MQWIDTTVAIGLQLKYRNGEPRALTLLYIELRRMAGLILSNWEVPSEKIEEYSHDAATGLVLQYIKDPRYEVKAFLERMKLECLSALKEKSLNPSASHPERHITRARENTISLDEATIAIIQDEDTSEDDHALVDGLSSYFAHFQWFRPAIRGLIPYIPKRWMLDHAVQLKAIFKESKKNGKNTD